MMANWGVAASWGCNKKARSGHMSTDGIDVWSYGLRVGLTTTDGGKIALRYTAPHNFRSMTTSRHVGLAMRYADCTIEPSSITRGG